MKPYLQPGYDQPEDGKRARDLAGADERDPQGVALHQLRLLRLRVQRDGVRPGVHGAAGAREGDALRRRSARRGQGRAARRVQHRARDLGVHPLLLLQRALPQGCRPARCDREARRRGDEGGHRRRHGRQARQVVRHLREDDRLAARDGARPEDAGHRLLDQGDEVRDGAGEARQGAHCRSRRTSPRASRSRGRSTTSSSSRTARARRGSSRASTRSAGSSTSATPTGEEPAEEGGRHEGSA